MTKLQDEILKNLEPLFTEAIANGKWFWNRYSDSWFSPDEMRYQHSQGKFIWGPANWELRNPEELVNRIIEKISRLQLELRDVQDRISQCPK